jgi:hypothetical protein
MLAGLFFCTQRCKGGKVLELEDCYSGLTAHAVNDHQETVVFACKPVVIIDKYIPAPNSTCLIAIPSCEALRGVDDGLQASIAASKFKVPP